MADLRDYPISFPYGATSAPYSATRPHRGSDRAAPLNTPIIIGATQIGLVGTTGLSTGPHCHLQAGKDEWAQTTINPDAYWFKGGTVVKVGFGTEWGNYVCIRVGDVNAFYCHLNKITTSVGQVIEEVEVSTMDLNLARQQADVQWGWGERSPERDEILKRDIVGKESNERIDFMYNHKWGVDYRLYLQKLKAESINADYVKADVYIKVPK